MQQGDSGQSHRRLTLWWTGRVTLIVLIACTMIWALNKGLEIRRDAWTKTDGVRFVGDVNNAFNWGLMTNDIGVFNLYDVLESGTMTTRKIDYPPLRLFMAHRWVKWAKVAHPDIRSWRNDYDLTYPMLRLNIIAEVASSVLVFAIVYLWRVRADNAQLSPGARASWYRGFLPATFGALLFWFNPAIIWNGHCWPQWDVWLIPFFLAAVLCASLNRWILAGIFVGVGACFKGQMLLAAPVLLLWPLFQLRIRAVVGFVGGFVIAIFTVALPWMHLHKPAIVWMMSMILACGLATLAMTLCYRRWWWVRLIIIACALPIAYPWYSGADFWIKLIAPAILLVWGLACMLPVRWTYATGVLFASGILYLTIPYFGAQTSWLTMGFFYGTEKFQNMVTGNGAYNIPRMMREYLQSTPASMEMVKMPWLEMEIAFATLMRCIYAVLLVLCGIGAAIQDHRKSGRFLTAMVAPWLLFFMTLTQMHGRYTIWAAGIAALLAGTSTGMALLGVMVAIISWIGIMNNQLVFRTDEVWDPELLRRIDLVGPHLGWVLLVISLIFLYVSLVPRRTDAIAQRKLSAPQPPTESAAFPVVQS